MLLSGNTSDKTNKYVTIGKHSQEQVDQIKYLGIILDNKLSWKPHIQHICTQLSSGSWALTRLRNYVDISSLKIVNYSLIYSRLQYCIGTWGLASAIALYPLEKLHKRIIRITTRSSYCAHTTPLFDKLNFLKIIDIFNFEIAKTMFMLYKNLNPNINQNLVLSKNTHSYNSNTRHSANSNYFLIRKRTEMGKKSFSFIGPKIWQSVQELISYTLHSFKRKLKLHMIAKYSCG